MKITIVGGAGAMGRFFSKLLAEEFDVVIYDTGKGAKETAEKLGITFGENLEKEVGESDAVLISVPIDVAADVIKMVSRKMKKGSLLMDITSIKREPVEAMRLAEGIEAVGLHPMFGPTATSLRGQRILVIPVREGKWFPRIKRFFQKKGAILQLVSAEEHDSLMAVIQGLTHFSHLALAFTYKKLGFDLEEARKYASPSFNILLDFVGRTLAQPPHLYFMIQSALDERVHEIFIQQCSELSRILKDKERFSREFSEAKVHFKKTEEALRKSDEIIQKYITS
jgi:prephenate dehydrogenase